MYKQLNTAAVVLERVPPFSSINEVDLAAGTRIVVQTLRGEGRLAYCSASLLILVPQSCTGALLLILGPLIEFLSHSLARTLFPVSLDRTNTYEAVAKLTLF